MGFLRLQKKFLEAFGSFNFGEIDSWKQIEGLYDVRNIFVHGGGDKEKAHLGTVKRLNRLLQMDIGLSEHNDQMIIDDNEFCYFALNSISNFFQELINQYHDNLGAGFWVVK